MIYIIFYNCFTFEWIYAKLNVIILNQMIAMWKKLIKSQNKRCNY